MTEKIEEGTKIEGGIIPASEPVELTKEEHIANAEALGLQMEIDSQIGDYESQIEVLVNQGRHEEVEQVKLQMNKFIADNETPVVKEEVKEEVKVELTPAEEIAELKAKLQALENTAEEPVVKSDDEIVDTLEKAGMNYDSVYKEHVENGVLSAETLADLEKAGFSKAVVDSIIEIKVAQADAVVNKLITDVCGSQEGFDAMAEWVNENFSEAEIAKYEAGVTTEHAEIYLKDAYNRFQSATKAPVVVRGGGKQVTSPSDVYTHEAQITRDMSSNKYKTDSRFREQVARKMDAFYGA